MVLAPSARLGAYEISAPLGVGGMGEVYRARDTPLGREVAIEVLADSVAREPSHLARFEREARTVAAVTEDKAGPHRDFIAEFPYLGPPHEAR
jgi:serine/threonine protein kinase